ncbi:MAG: ATP-binding protein, partial [Casimicrobiaceae bacterium]
RDGAGVWDLFEAARRALQSYKPTPGCTPLRLSSARLEGGEIRAVKAPLDVEALITDVRRVAVAAASTKTVPVILHLADDAPRTIASDGTILRQILLNLLSNAIKFTSAGRITLRVSPVARGSAGFLAFAVEDTGVGIPDSAKARLFELFASSGSVRGTPGHGVGLFLSRQLAQTLGGTLEIDSQVDRGTTARLIIPLEEVEAAPAPLAEVPERPAIARRVLVIDDHPVNREIIAVGLRGRGHTVDAVATARAALEAAEETRYDVVLMDLDLPDMSGFEAARSMIERARARGVKPPALLALTASNLERDRAAAREAGMQGFVSKPATAETIAAAIEAACKDHSAELQVTAASEPVILDLRILEGLAHQAQTDPSVIERLLRLAREELPKDVARWRQAVLAGESELAKNAAHRISGAAALLGGHRLAEMSRAFMQGRLDAAQTSLEQELDLLLDALARFESVHRARAQLQPNV